MSCNLGDGSGTEELSGPEQTATFETILGQAQQTADAASGGDAVEAPTATEVALSTNTIEPPPTVPGKPAVTANVNANVREGPSTDFKGVGALLSGQSATIEGRDITGTWFFIVFTAGPGGKAWIAASTVSTSGDINSVPVVNSPPPYTATPSSTPLTPTASATSAETATPTTKLLWAGTWDLECPPFDCQNTSLTVNGSNVTGSFNFDDGSGAGFQVANLVGTLSADGKTLTGTITRPGVSPESFTVTLTGGGTFVNQQFRGTWDPDPFCGSRPSAPFLGC